MTKFLEKISVKKRIIAIVILSAGCIAVSTLFDFLQSMQVRQAVDNLYQHPLTVHRTIGEIEHNIVLIQREMRDIASGTDLNAGRSIVNRLHSDTLKKFVILQQRYLGDATEITQLEQLFTDWQAIRRKVINYVSLNRPDLAYEITLTESAEHINKLDQLIGDIRKFTDNKFEEFYQQAQQTSFRSVLIGLLLAIITIVIFLVTSLMVAVSINNQLKKLSRFSNQLSKGELLATLRIDGDNEIDNLGRELIAMRDNLKSLIYKNETTNKQLIESEKLAALGGLVAGVAHEVNTPLGISVTATSVITDIRDELKRSFRDQVLTSQQFEDLMERLTISSNMLDENLHRATRLIHDFKLTAVDQISDKRCSFNLKEILRALLTSMYPETRRVPVIPQLNGADEIMMNSLPGAVTQIVSNLIINSVRHAFYDQPEPEIDISFRTSGHNIILEYRDNGCGVHPSLHEKIFEPFYTSLHGGKVSGMGLTLVSNLVKQRLQGQISFTSAPGQGVHFVFTLPQELPTEEKEVEIAEQSEQHHL